jgi:hypothetical protein
MPVLVRSHDRWQRAFAKLRRGQVARSAHRDPVITSGSAVLGVPCSSSGAP